MEEIFISQINIHKVRHLENLEIKLSETERKHLILTGKNGSGKTSLLETMKSLLTTIQNNLFSGVKQLESTLEKLIKEREKLIISMPALVNTDLISNRLSSINQDIENFKETLKPFSTINLKLANQEYIINIYKNGYFLLTYFKSKRGKLFNHRNQLIENFKKPNGIQQIKLKDIYTIEEKSNPDFIQYLVNLKADKSFARDDNDLLIAEEIDKWFDKFEKQLQFIFEDETLKLEFDRRNYTFQLISKNREPFDFNTLSDGYSAILDIVTELILRMENKNAKNYDIQGIVLIDEIETHLHIDLQKKILPFLTNFFPKIQFIVTTHSPFVLSSIENAIIYDLEKQIRVEDLSAYSIDGIIESYFDSDKYSENIKQKFNRYENLVNRNDLTDNELKEMIDLRKFLKSIPAKLATELVTAFQQIELQRLAKVNG
jgi:predicted ATP-binding protein involved in virulence